MLNVVVNGRCVRVLLFFWEEMGLACYLIIFGSVHFACLLLRTTCDGHNSKRTDKNDVELVQGREVARVARVEVNAKPAVLFGLVGDVMWDELRSAGRRSTHYN